MTTVQDQIEERQKQSNTRSLLLQILQRVDQEQVRLITDNKFNYDKVRIDNVKDFIQVQIDEVNQTISNIENAGVSGV